MKVVLITPWANAWVPYYKAAIERRGHEFQIAAKAHQIKGADVVLHGWTGQGPMVDGARNILFMRRYELFDGGLARTEWKKADALICVNKWIANVVSRTFKTMGVAVPVHTIYNGTDTKNWIFRSRKPNNRVGMACHVHPKKNLPLALQIMALLPANYELHIAGQIQDPCTAEYLNHVGHSIKRPVYLYDHIPPEQLDMWWENMGVCLSTSLSEGNPNNVIEAMAKGIKPVVHNWPGAKDQFSETFDTAPQAAEMILAERYASEEYRAVVEQKFSLSNIERVLDIALNMEVACES